MRRKAPSVPFTESKPFKKGLQVTLTPLQPATADFPGPELHTTCPVHFPKHHHLIGGNEHVLMASSFKSSTHFDSIENTIFVLLLFFCFASIWYVCRSENKAPPILFCLVLKSCTDTEFSGVYTQLLFQACVNHCPTLPNLPQEKLRKIYEKENLKSKRSCPVSGTECVLQYFFFFNIQRHKTTAVRRTCTSSGNKCH